MERRQSVTVSRSVLKSVVDKVRQAIPDEGRIIFMPEGDVYGVSGELGIYASLPTEGFFQDKTFAVPSKVLSDFLGTCSGEEVHISLSGAGDKLKLRSGSFSATLVVEAPSVQRDVLDKLFPVYSDEKAVLAFASLKDFERLLNLAFPVASDDVNKTVLNGVYVTERGIAYASNNYAAVRVEVGGVILAGEPRPIFLPKRLAAAIKANRDWARFVWVEKGIISVGGDFCYYSAPHLKVEYPVTDTLFEPYLDRDDGWVSLEDSDIERALGRIKVFSSSRDLDQSLVQLVREGSEIQLLSQKAVGDFRDRAEMGEEAVSFDVLANPDFLLHGLGHAGQFFLDSDRRRMVFRSEDQIFYYIVSLGTPRSAEAKDDKDDDDVPF